jgi:hypothetical protein
MWSTLYPTLRENDCMNSRRIRLGDDIDDYCPRCRLIMNHGVVSMVGEDVKKARCHTCMSEHVFRRGQIPARRKTAVKKLFDEVLKGMKPSEPESEQPSPPEPDGEQPSPSEPDGEQPSPPEPVQPQRRLYTIRRTTGGKTPTGGSRKP